MPLSLYFNLAKFPRTITRDEWKEIWRWKRVTEKQLAIEMEKQWANFVALGATYPELKERIIDEFIRPPIIVHDRQEF